MEARWRRQDGSIAETISSGGIHLFCCLLEGRLGFDLWSLAALQADPRASLHLAKKSLLQMKVTENNRRVPSPVEVAGQVQMFKQQRTAVSPQEMLHARARRTLQTLYTALQLSLAHTRTRAS